MKKLSNDELNDILNEHEKWLRDEGGKRANLSDCDLSGRDLIRRMNLGKYS